MSGVTFVARYPGGILSLQATATRTSAIQTRLATGKRVNSALDNPKSFFTAQSLNARASELNVLLDNVAQAQQTVKTVTQGIGMLTKLVQTAKSLAQQARQAEPPLTSYDAIEVTGTAGLSGEAAGTVTGNVDTSGGFAADVDGLQIQVGADDLHRESSVARREHRRDYLAHQRHRGLGVRGHRLARRHRTISQLTADSTDVSFQVQNSAAATALGIAGRNGTSTNLLQAVSGLSGTSLTVQSGGEVRRNHQLWNWRRSGVHARRNSSPPSQALGFMHRGPAPTFRSVSQPRPARKTRFPPAVRRSPRSGCRPAASNTARSTPQPRSEPRRLSGAVQHPVAAGRRADAGLVLRRHQSADRRQSPPATFNESGSSTLTVTGASLNATGLGIAELTGDDFQSDFAIDEIVGDLDAALVSLRSQATRFGSSLTILQTREDFTKTMVRTLESGADDLTLADTNEEGANLLALQTRQALSTTALSLSSIGAQSVLRLFQ